MTPPRRPVLLSLLIVLAAGCAVGTSPSEPPGSTVGASPIPVATATAAVATASATPAPTAPSSPTVTPAPPPQAEILAPGTIFAGYLGSYEVDGTGSDGPWVPFDSLSKVVVGAGQTVTIRFVDGTDIGEADAVIAAAADRTGSNPQAVSVAPGGNAASVVVGPLPSGSWVLSVRLFRADGRGDGTTYWAVTAG